MASINRSHKAAIEFGMCRSGRDGGSSGSATVGYRELREQPNGMVILRGNCLPFGDQESVGGDARRDDESRASPSLQNARARHAAAIVRSQTLEGYSELKLRCLTCSYSSASRPSPTVRTNRGRGAPISFAALAPHQLLFDTRSVLWDNSACRKQISSSGDAVRLTCHRCPLIVFVARCALAARLTHYLSGWCATGSQILGRNISSTLALEIFQSHGRLNLRTSCQFALGIGPGWDRKKRRRSTPLYLY